MKVYILFVLHVGFNRKKEECLLVQQNEKPAPEMHMEEEAGVATGDHGKSSGEKEIPKITENYGAWMMAPRRSRRYQVRENQGGK